MRIIPDEHGLALRDRPGPFWALGLFLLAGGVLGVAMPLGLAWNLGALAPWERLASLGIGCGVVSGALWFLARSPSSSVRLNLHDRRVHLVRRGLAGRERHEFGFDDVERLDAQQGADSDGDPVWRPVVHLRSGVVIALSELWSHDQAGVEHTVAVVAGATKSERDPTDGPVEEGIRREGAPQ